MRTGQCARSPRRSFQVIGGKIALSASPRVTISLQTLQVLARHLSLFHHGAHGGRNEGHGAIQRQLIGETANPTRISAWRTVVTQVFVVLRGPRFFLRELRGEESQLRGEESQLRGEESQLRGEESQLRRLPAQIQRLSRPIR